MLENDKGMVIFDREISNYNFRYTGDTTIEVTKTGSKFRNVLREIPCKKGITLTEFEKEISFWFFENGASLSADI